MTWPRTSEPAAGCRGFELLSAFADHQLPGVPGETRVTLRSHCPVGDARLNKVLGCFGPRVETDLPEHFAVLLGIHVVVPKGAISIKKVGCDGIDRCGQFVEQCSRLQVSTVLWVLGSFGAPPVGGLLKVQSQRLPYFVIGQFVPSGQVERTLTWVMSRLCQNPPALRSPRLSSHRT
jgi:hypothetical protein